MTEYATSISAAELFQRLKSEQLLENEDSCRELLQAKSRARETPLYIRILIGVGAFFAWLFFLGFLRLAYFIDLDSISDTLLWGTIFSAAAILLLRWAKDDGSISNSFQTQSSFALMALGKTLLVSGVVLATHSSWGVSLALLIITAATYPVYRMSVDRFLSSLALLLSLAANILFNFKFMYLDVALFNGFFFFQLSLAGFLFTHGKVDRTFAPLAYALMMSLCVNVLAILFLPELQGRSWAQSVSPAVVNVMLTTALVALIAWAAGGVHKLAQTPLIIAVSGAILLGLVSATGVLLSISLMILGYARHERLVTLTGILFMPVFLVLYYYQLETSLLTKSGFLIASGSVLLLGKFYLSQRSAVTEVGP